MMFNHFTWLSILMAALLTTSFGKETILENENGRSGSGSMFTSLLKTLSSSNVSPTCPGRCFNALAAMVCTKVIDKPGMCSSGYRCCQNFPSEDEAATHGELSTLKEENSETTSHSDKLDSAPETIKLRDTTVTLELKVDEKKTDDSERTKNKGAVEKVDSDSSALLQYSPSASVKVCRGVCVAKRISSFCEAIIDVEGLCKAELRCCVPANLFDGVDNVPKEFIILNPTTDKNRTEQVQPSTEIENIPKPSATPTISSLATSIDVTKTTRKTTTLIPSTTEGTTSSPREQGVNSANKKNGDNLVDGGNGDIPPEKQCKGTCVAGFFAFLCDSIDRSGECPRGGRCCVTQKSPRPKPGSKPHRKDNNVDDTPQRKTTPKPRRRPTTTTITTTTSPIPPTPTRGPPPPPCPGRCLPVSVSSRCQSPSKLVVATGCRDDEICCDDAKRPGSQVPEALGTILSLFGGGGPQNNKRPSRPTRAPRPTTTTTATTTTPTTTTEAAPECPGTCIAPILSFTCFGNAEITELFKCHKDKQSCCAPKSAIRELKRRYHISIAAKNDTVYNTPFHPHGHYDPSIYVQQQPYHQLPERGNFHHPIYQTPSPLQPPPPPPPHLFEPEHYQPSEDRPLPPPLFENPWVENPTPEEKQPFPPYHQPAQEFPEAPQHQPSYPYSPHSNPTFHQPGPAYHQNQSSDHPHPPTITTPSSVLTTAATFESENQVTNKYVCGVKGTNRAARVVGGEDSVPGEWCWQVALINSLNQYLCGGALIGTQWVLTAAHCVTNIVRSGDAIYVRVGDHDLTTRYGSPGAQTIPVATTYIHHNHNSQTLDNDIALLKLSSHAELGNGVCLVCLPARGVSQVAGKRCTVTGYGYMGETGPIPLRIREAEIPVVSDNECVRQINAVTEKIFILPASSFCAGGESGHDACQGDGGGPLVCNVDNYFELSGLVSWGFGCGRKDVPGVYVKVSSFIGWINQIISVNNL